MSVLVTLAVALTKINLKKGFLWLSLRYSGREIEAGGAQSAHSEEGGGSECAHCNPGNGAAHSGQVFPPQLVLSK